jgi:hypothetical protein|nr:MAG TPA: hypothetical protein [Caudoviricetes sp.]
MKTAQRTKVWRPLRYTVQNLKEHILVVNLSYHMRLLLSNKIDKECIT